MFLQRNFSIVGPLKGHLANRWARLRSMLSALNKIKNGGLEELKTLIEPSVTKRLAELIEERFQKTEAALNALRAQYPDYANKVQTRHLDKITLNQELSKYRELYEDAIITTEIFTNLETDLKNREQLASEEPELDLGLNRLELVSAVPLFENIDAEKRQSIANILQPRLVIPGEIICKEGDAGDSMFFISSGALSVNLKDGAVTLGSGEFFGEIALLKETPRVATVAANSFCELLVLRKGDFEELLVKSPQLKEEIEKVAAARLS
jgi:CPA1 family monovalent cation:H+ antiporter